MSDTAQGKVGRALLGDRPWPLMTLAGLAIACAGAFSERWIVLAGVAAGFVGVMAWLEEPVKPEGSDDV